MAAMTDKGPLFLALTADRTYWFDEARPLCLGPWCLPAPAEMNTSDAAVLPYAFDDRRVLEQAYGYVTGVYNRLFPQLAAALNDVHGQQRSERFWKIFAGYWFRDFLDVLYERYRCLQVAAAHDPRLRVLTMDPVDYDTPEDQLGFMRRNTTDRYNQQLYSQIIDHLDMFDRTRRRVPAGTHVTAPSRGLRPVIKSGVQWLSLVGSRRNRYYLVSSYMWPRDLLGVARRLGIFPTIDTPRFTFAPGPLDHNRCRLSAIQAADPFEDVVRALLPVNVPRIYWENFSRLGRAVRRHYPSRTRLTLTSVGFVANEGFKLWAAHQAEEHGVPYVIVQHGGTYGAARWYSSEAYEASVADFYLTYGWSDAQRKNVVPFVANKLPHARNGRPSGRRDGDILWVLASFPRYAYSMYAVSSGPHFQVYLDEQARFLRALSDETLQVLKCRPYPHEYGWGDLEYITKRGRQFQRDRFRGSIPARIPGLRLLVVTYHATAFLEGLAANVPTIAYWNPAHWELRDDAVAAYDSLRSAGILHDTPEDAARKIDEVADDPFTWWARADVQAVREAFCARFARTSENAADTWSRWILAHAAPRRRDLDHALSHLRP
jgi:putative transferase (TIGR04331 family)